MINKYGFLCLFSVFIASVSQVLLKISANKSHKNKISEYLNSFVIIAYGMFILSTLLTVMSLVGISLSNVSTFESAGYIFILILSRIFLKESITFSKLAGNLLIITGILIFNCI